MSTRRQARERVMQALYAFELSGSDAQEIIRTVLKRELDPAAHAFATSLFLQTIDSNAETAEIIKQHTRNWELRRIALIDRILMRIAITELLGFPDIPPKVTINECIEVAKEYSTAQSGKFINGILDAILGDLTKAGKISKTGRGLVEISASNPVRQKASVNEAE
ncbi:MAG: transcription antitermination factor NusB [Bacteroidetes Order II. Incertae sedis bacterium]|nr:transcription antitermination factor NusB [Bacteroidetes Order II. bacterium]